MLPRTFTYHLLILCLSSAGLLIDGNMIKKGRVESANEVMIPIDDFYFGHVTTDIAFNYPLVSTIGFDGCIDGVTIMTRPMDLSNNIKAFGVKPGCPTKVRI